LRGVELADIQIVNLIHDTPHLCPVLRDHICNPTATVDRFPRERELVIAQNGNPYEAGRWAPLSHLVPAHVRPVSEIEHQATSGPLRASHRSIASLRSPSDRAPRGHWRDAGNPAPAPARPSGARAGRLCGRRPAAAS